MGKKQFCSWSVNIILVHLQLLFHNALPSSSAPFLPLFMEMYFYYMKFFGYNCLPHPFLIFLYSLYTIFFFGKLKFSSKFVQPSTYILDNDIKWVCLIGRIKILNFFFPLPLPDQGWGWLCSNIRFCPLMDSYVMAGISSPLSSYVPFQHPSTSALTPRWCSVPR